MIVHNETQYLLFGNALLCLEKNITPYFCQNDEVFFETKFIIKSARFTKLRLEKIDFQITLYDRGLNNFKGLENTPSKRNMRTLRILIQK